MTQPTRRSFPYDKALLVGAIVLALISVGYRMYDVRSESNETEAANSAGPGADTVESLEARTRNEPDDKQAWRRLGFLYFEAGRFGNAAEAYQQAVRLDPDEPLLWSSLGEALVMASERDPMPEEALAAFHKANALDPKDPRARYFLSVHSDLSGDHEGAIGEWLALLEDTPVDAPWRDDLIRTIDQVGKINKIDVTRRLANSGAKSPAPRSVATQAIPGPSSADLAAASQIPPGEQREMAQGMVARLEKRLEGDPGNVDGWIMLIRSRMTLGEREKAKKALDDAVAANPLSVTELRQQAEVLGVR